MALPKSMSWSKEYIDKYDVMEGIKLENYDDR